MSVSALRDSNARLDKLLGSLQPEHTRVDRSPRILAAVLAEIRRAAEAWRPLQAESDQEVLAEIQRYRQLVRQLAELLPNVQGQLLQAKSQLEAERTRVQSAGAWAEARRSIL